MDPNEKLFYTMCVELLDNENGVTDTAYSSMLNYAEKMKYHETLSVLALKVRQAGNFSYRLPSGFSRTPKSKRLMQED